MPFVLTPLTAGALKRDTGTATFCCWTQRSIMRDGQAIEINDPQMTLTGKRGHSWPATGSSLSTSQTDGRSSPAPGKSFAARATMPGLPEADAEPASPRQRRYEVAVRRLSQPEITLPGSLASDTTSRAIRSRSPLRTRGCDLRGRSFFVGTHRRWLGSDRAIGVLSAGTDGGGDAARPNNRSGHIGVRRRRSSL